MPIRRVGSLRSLHTVDGHWLGRGGRGRAVPMPVHPFRNRCRDCSVPFPASAGLTAHVPTPASPDFSHGQVPVLSALAARPRPPRAAVISDWVALLVSLRCSCYGWRSVTCGFRLFTVQRYFGGLTCKVKRCLTKNLHPLGSIHTLRVLSKPCCPVSLANLFDAL